MQSRVGEEPTGYIMPCEHMEAAGAAPGRRWVVVYTLLLLLLLLQVALCVLWVGGCGPAARQITLYRLVLSEAGGGQGSQAGFEGANVPGLRAGMCWRAPRREHPCCQQSTAACAAVY